MAKNIGPGDAVITTPFTYIATSEVISLLGANSIFVDIYKSTYNIDATLIEQGINSSIKKGLNPKGIISVDLFGLPFRYRILNQVAKKYNLFVIEDAAQSYGSSIGVKKHVPLVMLQQLHFFQQSLWVAMVMGELFLPIMMD